MFLKPYVYTHIHREGERYKVLFYIIIYVFLSLLDAVLNDVKLNLQNFSP